MYLYTGAAQRGVNDAGGERVSWGVSGGVAGAAAADQGDALSGGLGKSWSASGAPLGDQAAATSPRSRGQVADVVRRTPHSQQRLQSPNKAHVSPH